MNLNEAYNQIDPWCSHGDAFELGWNAALENQWQDIETAPKDGSYILIDDDECIKEGCWCESSKFDTEGFYSCEKYKQEIFNAVRWMPKPPQGGKK